MAFDPNAPFEVEIVREDKNLPNLDVTSGLLAKGNIDLTKRKVLNNQDETISTESSITIYNNDETRDFAVNIPTIINGKRYSEKEAIDYYRRNGEHLGKYDTIENAVSAAQNVHLIQQERYPSTNIAQTQTNFDPNAPFDVSNEMPLTEGQAVPEGYETFHDPMQGTMIRPIAQERTPTEAIIGAGETALAIGTGATSGALGHITGVLKGLAESIASGKYGTEEGAKLVEKTASDLMQSLTYAPKTEAGQEYTQAVGEALAPLEALGPLGAELEMAARTARPTAKTMSKGATAREAVKQAEGSGITPITSDIFPPKTFVGKTAQSVTERIPVVGTGPVRATQQAQRVSAVKSYLSESGVVGSESILDDVMGSLTKARNDKITKFIDLKKESFSNIQGKVIPITKTLSTIDEEISRLTNMKTEGVKPLINVLNDYKKAFQDQDIINIEALRKQLGDQLDDTTMQSVSTEAGKSSKNVYKSLNEDIGSFIKDNGEAKDFNKWKVANNNLSSLIGELENNTLKSVLRKASSSPEDVKKLLFSKKPSDIKLIYKNLSNDGRANARAAILHEALNKSGGIEDLSIDKFQTNLKRLENSTGIFFKGEEKKALDGLQKALKLTKQAGIASTKPPTGAELTAFATPTAFTWLLGSDPVLGLTATAGLGGMARVYESRPVRNLFIQLSSAPEAKQLPIYTSLISAIESQKQKEDK